MALSKKHSRKITVKSEVFRYSITSSRNEDTLLLDIVAQHEEGNGSKLYASGVPTKGDFWFDVSCQPNQPPDPKDYPSINPELVAKTIERAISAGWIYDEPGQNYKIKIET